MESTPSMSILAQYSDEAIKLLMTYGPKLLLAIITLIVGLWVIKLIVRGLKKVLEARNVDSSLRGFLASISGVLLKIMLVISVASMVGIDVVSFVALLGAAGLAIGMALSGNLSNFAGGVLILLFKPFKVGDFIDAQGHTGVVIEVQVFHTILKTPDNKTIIIPNGALSNGSITNFSTEPTRRVDFSFGIGYGDDIRKAKDVLNRLIQDDERILADPEPMVAVSELADSSVNLVVRVWSKSADYWGIYFDMQENVKNAFDKEGISIPFPQQDVHIINQ
ncbi:mechanosensitive ion channel [candidate division KSB1 bacterium]|nr:mechanosensitive ion channel [candidate division KSB1 bacterium]